ncbi:MAG: hypothetical protein AB7G28_19870 [Pirellulales bacterium]
MKRTWPAVVCLFIGLGFGWYFGYTRPVAKHQRELLAEYQQVKEQMGLTDVEMAEAGRNFPQYFRDMKRQDEIAAAVALSALMKLEAGETDAAKASLLQAVGSYYRLYHDNDGDRVLLDKMAVAARDYPSIATEISRDAD